MEWTVDITSGHMGYKVAYLQQALKAAGEGNG